MRNRGEVKKNPTVLKMWGGRRFLDIQLQFLELRDELENCLKMHYFRLSFKKFMTEKNFQSKNIQLRASQPLITIY